MVNLEFHITGVKFTRIHLSIESHTFWVVYTPRFTYTYIFCIIDIVNQYTIN